MNGAALYTEADVRRCVEHVGRGCTAITAAQGRSMAYVVAHDTMEFLGQQGRLLPDAAEHVLAGYTRWLAEQQDIIGPDDGTVPRTHERLAEDFLRQAGWAQHLRGTQ